MAKTTIRTADRGGRLLHEMNRRYQEAWTRRETALTRRTGPHQKVAQLTVYLPGGAAYRLWREPSPAAMLLPFPVENLENHKRPPAGSVAIVIPLKDHGGLLSNCLRSIRSTTRQPTGNHCFTDNGSTCPRTLRYLERLREKAGSKSSLIRVRSISRDSATSGHNKRTPIFFCS